jgi:hypothetical protein
MAAGGELMLDLIRRCPTTDRWSRPNYLGRSSDGPTRRTRGHDGSRPSAEVNACTKRALGLDSELSISAESTTEPPAARHIR